MKFQEAIEIINGKENQGYMVSFEKKEGGMLRSDYFPDKHAGEVLIKTEEEAWELAKRFASKTKGKCVNIYVIGSNFVPVIGYEMKRIINRY